MGRPRSYRPDAVVGAARDVFWAHGYGPTSVDDLEQRTGLNRSSLYHAFGSKRDLFEAALRCYIEQDIDEMLGGLQRAGAGPRAIVDFFTRLARSFRADPERAARGCLMVNSIVELGQRDPDFAQAAALHRDRLRKSFAAALAGADAGADGELRDVIRARAELLTATTMGIFVTARLDPADAADVCDRVAGEVSTWRFD